MQKREDWTRSLPRTPADGMPEQPKCTNDLETGNSFTKGAGS